MKVYLVMYTSDPYEPDGVDSIWDSREKADNKREEMLKETHISQAGVVYPEWFPDNIHVEEWEVQ